MFLQGRTTLSGLTMVMNLNQKNDMAFCYAIPVKLCPVLVS